MASAQEITGWISPSDLFTDSKWFKFFSEVAGTESIGGNAGEDSFGVNFYVDRKTGLVPLYDQGGVVRPLVGNIQDLPRNIAENRRLAGVTARVRIVDWMTGKVTMTEIFKGKQVLSPTANRELLKGIVRYNLDIRNLGKVTKASVPLKSAVAPKSPRVGFVGKWFGGKSVRAPAVGPIVEIIQRLIGVSADVAEAKKFLSLQDKIKNGEELTEAERVEFERLQLYFNGMSPQIMINIFNDARWEMMTPEQRKEAEEKIKRTERRPRLGA